MASTTPATGWVTSMMTGWWARLSNAMTGTLPSSSKWAARARIRSASHCTWPSL
jgi:hypothetical protein